MLWHGSDIQTTGEILDAVLACKSQEEAEEFMALYSVESEHAKENIGYMAGYCSHEDSQRIYDWFDCQHPIFGTTAPTAEEAFNVGIKLGELCRLYGYKKAITMMGLDKKQENRKSNKMWFMGIKDLLKE